MKLFYSLLTLESLKLNWHLLDSLSFGLVPIWLFELKYFNQASRRGLPNGQWFTTKVFCAVERRKCGGIRWRKATTQININLLTQVSHFAFNLFSPTLFLGNGLAQCGDQIEKLSSWLLGRVDWTSLLVGALRDRVIKFRVFFGYFPLMCWALHREWLVRQLELIRWYQQAWRSVRITGYLLWAWVLFCKHRHIYRRLLCELVVLKDRLIAHGAAWVLRDRQNTRRVVQVQLCPSEIRAGSCEVLWHGHSSRLGSYVLLSQLFRSSWQHLASFHNGLWVRTLAHLGLCC